MSTATKLRRQLTLWMIVGGVAAAVGIWVIAVGADGLTKAVGAAITVVGVVLFGYLLAMRLRLEHAAGESGVD